MITQSDPPRDSQPEAVQALIDTVQRNSHISDGPHAQDYTLCIYLLKMRELYRWEHRLPFRASIPKHQLSQWIESREALWDELEGEAFSPLSWGETRYDTFDQASINQQLAPLGLIYGAGYGPFLKPIFFLGQRLRHIQQGELEIFISGRELVRDITAPPAVMQERTIIIRRESLRRYLWELIESGEWNKGESAIHRAMAAYDFHEDFDHALDQMTDAELKNVLQHEIGEYRIGRVLGHDWERMLATLGRGRAEFIARAARDHLVDCQYVLPRLIGQEAESSLHFYRANLNGMRAQIFPQLVQAFDQWRDTHRLERLEQVVQSGLEYWCDVSQHMLDLFRRHGGDSGAHITELVEG